MLLIYLAINMLVDFAVWNECCLGSSVWGWADGSSATLGFARISWWLLQPALFKNLNYFNIWCLKIARDQRASLPATIIVFILAYERAGDRRALIHAENTNWGWKHGCFGVHEFTWNQGKKKTGGAKQPKDPTGMYYRPFLCEQVINETFKLCVRERLRGTGEDRDR